MGCFDGPVRPTPQAAQQDAERFRHALVELGYEEQRGVKVGAHALLESAEAIVGWRGCVNLTWSAFAAVQDERMTMSRSVPSRLADPTA